jgi:CRP-like cAMP-binding protein
MSRSDQETELSHYKREMKKSISESFSLCDEGVEEIFKTIQFRSLFAGEIVLNAGAIAWDCCLILKGCVRQYHLMEGEEKTTFFYTEGQWFASYNSANKKEPVNHFLSCVEDTILAVMNIEKEQELYKKYPEFESACRTGVEEQLDNYQELMVAYMTSTPKERYLNLLKNHPDLLQRVPQYQLASYLGVAPETLSRIRKRIMADK